MVKVIFLIDTLLVFSHFNQIPVLCLTGNRTRQMGGIGR